MKHRVFLAVNLPDEVKHYLASLIEELKEQNQRRVIKWVDSTLLHITLSFLGDLDDEQIEEIKILVKEELVNFNQTILELDSIGAFPELDKPRVVFVEAKDESKIIYKLQKSLTDKFNRLGMELDQRPWKAHITVARVRDRGELKGIDYKIERGTTWQVQTIDLMESVLTPQGPEYTALEKFKLKE